MSTNTTNTSKVFFTKQQYELLNKLFPEVLHSSTTPEATVREAIGARRVVHSVQQRLHP